MRVERVWWKIRVAMYGTLALPGLLTFLGEGLMPPMISSIMYILTALANVAACQATLPGEKEWRWYPLPCQRDPEARKKAEEKGGKVTRTPTLTRTRRRGRGQRRRAARCSASSTAATTAPSP